MKIFDPCHSLFQIVKNILIFRIERFPSRGQYDLKIINATYNRDNGNFNCMVKEAGTGKTIHTKSIGLTVLLKPSAPRIYPPSPVAIEGKPLNLTCSSTGGSPPPQIKWYREGHSQLLESTLFLGSNKVNHTGALSLMRLYYDEKCLLDY